MSRMSRGTYSHVHLDDDCVQLRGSQVMRPLVVEVDGEPVRGAFLDANGELVKEQATPGDKLLAYAAVLRKCLKE